MFDFFKKKKEIKTSKDFFVFFSCLVKILPIKYNYLELQINDDFIIAFKNNILGFENSFTFVLNARLESKYLNVKLAPYFILKGIEVWHLIEKRFIEIELDILNGILGGFKMENIDFDSYDFNKFNVSEINEKHFENKDLIKLLKNFNNIEQTLIILMK